MKEDIELDQELDRALAEPEEYLDASEFLAKVESRLPRKRPRISKRHLIILSSLFLGMMSAVLMLPGLLDLPAARMIVNDPCLYYAALGGVSLFLSCLGFWVARDEC